MLTKQSLVAVLAATTFLTAGVAYAADQAAQSQMSAQQKSVDKDVGKLSAVGSKAYMEINAARVAIFDGKTDEAKKLVNEADADMAKAKSDETVFMKAEADMNGPGQTADDATKAGAPAAKADAAAPKDQQADAQDAKTRQDMKTPKEWLPVDGEMSIDEDLTANPTKQKAVADANKSLEKGDAKGAMEKLKVADINIDYAIAVVPLKQTMADVHQAATAMSDGKYYEASQILRAVQDSTRFDVLDINGTPKKGGAMQDQKTATH